MTDLDKDAELSATLDLSSGVLAGLADGENVAASLESVRVGPLEERPDEDEDGALWLLYEEQLLTQYREDAGEWVVVGGVGRADDRVPKTHIERADVSEELVIPVREAHEDVNEDDEGIVYVKEDDRLIHRIVE